MQIVNLGEQNLSPRLAVISCYIDANGQPQSGSGGAAPTGGTAPTSSTQISGVSRDPSTYAAARTIGQSAPVGMDKDNDAMMVSNRKLLEESPVGTFCDVVKFASNESKVILGSASRTTTQTSADQVNRSCRGLIVVVDVTVVGTGSITFKVQGKDANGVYYDILVGAAIVTNSTNIYRVLPDLTAAANSIAKDIMPRTFRVVVTANNANAITYSVAAELVG